VEIVADFTKKYYFLLLQNKKNKKVLNFMRGVLNFAERISVCSRFISAFRNEVLACFSEEVSLS
jgi:hypothetical protein